MMRRDNSDELYVPNEWLVASTAGSNAALPAPPGAHFSVDLLQDIAWSERSVPLSNAEIDHLVACPLCQEEVEIAVLGARPEEREFEPSGETVARVLRAPRVMRRMPHVQMPTPTRARRGVGAHAFAALGVTPWSFAAAMVVHLAIFATTGAWIAANTRRFDAQVRMRHVVVGTAPLYYYFAPPTGLASRARQGHVREQDPAAAASRRTATADSLARIRLREVAGALDRTLLFEGREPRIRRADSTSLAEIVRILGIVRDIGVRLKPIVDADAKEAQSLLPLANRNGALVARFLRDRGVDTSRIRVSPPQLMSFACAADARECPHAAQRVHITIDTTSTPRQP